MIHDDLKLKGRLDIVVTSEDGVVKQEESVDNLVVTSGKNFVASRMAGTSASVMSHMAIGTDSTGRQLVTLLLAVSLLELPLPALQFQAMTLCM